MMESWDSHPRLMLYLKSILFSHDSKQEYNEESSEHSSCSWDTQTVSLCLQGLWSDTLGIGWRMCFMVFRFIYKARTLASWAHNTHAYMDKQFSSGWINDLNEVQLFGILMIKSHFLTYQLSIPRNSRKKNIIKSTSKILIFSSFLSLFLFVLRKLCLGDFIN